MSEPQQPKEFTLTREQATEIWEHLRDNTHGNPSWFWKYIVQTCSRPHPAPAQDVCGCNLDVVSPQKDCFGKYTWKESISSDDECFICPVYGYCIDVSARARAAREDERKHIIELLMKKHEAAAFYIMNELTNESIESLRGERR